MAFVAWSVVVKKAAGEKDSGAVMEKAAVANTRSVAGESIAWKAAVDRQTDYVQDRASFYDSLSHPYYFIRTVEIYSLYFNE